MPAAEAALPELPALQVPAPGKQKPPSDRFTRNGAAAAAADYGAITSAAVALEQERVRLSKRDQQLDAQVSAIQKSLEKLVGSQAALNA